MSDDMKLMLQAMLAGGIRHGLTAAGGALGVAGLSSDSNVNTMVGAAMILAGLVWSASQKYLSQKKVV